MVPYSYLTMSLRLPRFLHPLLISQGCSNKFTKAVVFRQGGLQRLRLFALFLKSSDSQVCWWSTCASRVVCGCGVLWSVCCGWLWCIMKRVLWLWCIMKRVLWLWCIMKRVLCVIVVYYEVCVVCVIGSVLLSNHVPASPTFLTPPPHLPGLLQ